MAEGTRSGHLLGEGMDTRPSPCHRPDVLPSLALAPAPPLTCFVVTTCVWSAQGWSQLHTQGLSKARQPQPALAQARVAGSCSTCLCLHLGGWWSGVGGRGEGKSLGDGAGG